MAFFGMVLAGAFLIIVILIVSLMVFFFTIAIILKIFGKKKNRKGMRVVGNVFLVLGIIFAIPVIVLFGSIIHGLAYEEVALPDGNYVYILEKDITRMKELAHMYDDAGIDELSELLEEEPNLIYYSDVNRKGILDYGLMSGNYDVVLLAIEHGAKFDDPNKYEHMSYEHNSMEFYLENIIGRKISYDDVEIVRLMFDKEVSTDYDNKYQYVYSNLFGKAIWSVLYNDEYVTTIEIEFIQVFIDNGLSKDENLILYDEKPSNISFSGEYNANVEKDYNYRMLMRMIGK